MSCVIGLIENGIAYVGGDSASVAGYSIRAKKIPKVFRVGSFIIGSVGSPRMEQLLHYHLNVPEQEAKQDDRAYIVCTFVEAVRALFKEHGFAKVENSVEEGGTFIVAYKGQVYEIYSDFQIRVTRDGLSAIGCGGEYALGAMKALEHMPPRKRIKKALKITAYFCNAVCAPFTVLSEAGKKRR